MIRVSRSVAAVLFLLLLTSNLSAQRRRGVTHPTVPTNPLYTQGGYADRTSVVQGGTITFHIATSQSPFTLEIVDLLHRDTVLMSVPNRTSTAQDCTGHFAHGCRWNATATINVPATWKSGYYAARFPTASGMRYAPFVVRAANPASTAPILVVSSTNTWQAYNTFGGRGAQPAELRGYTKVSFDRPYASNEGLGRYVDWEDDFAEWMAMHNMPFEVATDHDLDDPTLLSRYNAVVLIAHSQYWTAAARQNLENFSRSGGHIAVLGGNTMWWQTRREDNGRSMVAMKDYRRDPETVNFYDHPIYNPENLILGSSFRHGGYVNRAGDPSTWSDDPDTFRMKPINERTGFTVLDASSWVFAGTGVRAGQMFGNAAAGLEVDGVVFACDNNGMPGTVDGSDGTPLNYHILAYVPASHGYGTVGYYTNSAGGTVFNAGSQEWVSALFNDPVVAQITRNVLERFAIGGPMVHDPVTTATRARELFNCPQPSATVIPWWEGAVGSAKLTARCAVEGPAGLELSGSAETSIARNFAPTANKMGAASVQFSLNADAFQAGAFPTPLVTLRERTNGSTNRFADIELYRQNGENVVRVNVYRNDGNAATRGEWIPVPSGWQTVRLVWRSPGTTSLQVGSGAARAVENTRGGQMANELVLYSPATTGVVCIDRIEVAAP